MTLLTPVPLHFGHGHPVHADRGESVADLIELERLDNGHDDFHGIIPAWARSCGKQGQAALLASSFGGLPSRRCEDCKSSPVPVLSGGRKPLTRRVLLESARAHLRRVVTHRPKPRHACTEIDHARKTPPMHTSWATAAVLTR